MHWCHFRQWSLLLNCKKIQPPLHIFSMCSIGPQEIMVGHHTLSFLAHLQMNFDKMQAILKLVWFPELWALSWSWIAVHSANRQRHNEQKGKSRICATGFLSSFFFYFKPLFQMTSTFFLCNPKSAVAVVGFIYVVSSIHIKWKRMRKCTHCYWHQFLSWSNRDCFIAQL